MKDLALRTHISLSTRWHALALRCREDAGQTSVEYLGVIVVIVALIGALSAAIPGVVPDIVKAIKTQITEIGGG